MLTFYLRNTILNVRFTTTRCRKFSKSINRFVQLPQLSSYDVNLVLRENEFAHTFTDSDSPIMGYESNQLASNRPLEDSRTEASFIHKNAFICGVFDGHGGPACAQVISKRLLRYIAAAVIDRTLLREEIAKGCTSQSFLKCHNDKVDFIKEIQPIYEDSFAKYIQEIIETEAGTAEAIEKACLILDNDLSLEAQNHLNIGTTMSVAMSGSVACVAHVEGKDVHVATVGDCAAVMGYQNDTGQWMPKKLSHEHNTDNIKEIKRILSEHPPSEAETAIRNDRLLGQLAPLRAFGDFRYKWDKDLMQKLVVDNFGPMHMPAHYETPPYLTARPDVVHHVITPADKFLVIASDGLWDFLSPKQVVTLVGEHIMSKKGLEPVRLPEGDVTLDKISDNLTRRKAGREKRKPLDQNSATHLIRNALGGTEYGIEHSKISYYLTLPQDVVRLYRDDITITVLYLNSDYTKQEPSAEAPPPPQTPSSSESTPPTSSSSSTPPSSSSS